MNRKTWNANPSRDLSYTSLVIDEQNRAQHAHKITDTARCNATPVNGNLASVIPDIQEEGVRQSLPRRFQADTSTRTVFKDEFYRPREGISEYVQDPAHDFHSVRALPHMPLNELAPADTRIRRHKPQYESPLGPGYYEPDPLGERSTGLLTIGPGEVHHTVQYARDPTRASAAFLSPTRGRTAPDIAMESAAPPVVSRMTEPDYAYWRSKGCWAPRGDRVIEAERWGRNARETLPPAEERPQSVYTPAVTTDGHPSSCEAYTSARLTPAYKVAFSSGLPRTLALPLGIKPDTRLQVKAYDDITAARPDVGPGSYNPEAPRMRSTNAAYENSTPYYSLASGTPVEDSSRSPSAAAAPISTPLAALLPPQLQHQLAAAGTLSLLTPASVPGTPGTTGGVGSVSRSRQALGVTPLAVQASTGGSTAAAVAAAGPYSAPASPSALRAAAARAERTAAAALLASVATSRDSAAAAAAAGVSRDHSVPRSPLASRSAAAAGGGGAGAFGFGLGQGQFESGGASGDEDGGMGRAGGLQQSAASWLRAQSAPASSHPPAGNVTAAMRAAQAKQFTKLVFLKRHTPCSSLLRSHLVVAADLKRERQRLRNGG